MKNFDIIFEGPKNRWLQKPGGYVTWFSASFETGFEVGKFQTLSTHLWLFGFQIFEFCVYRKR